MKKAFTLIELLVVIIVISILATLLLPVLNKAKQQSQGVVCLNNLKQITLAWKEYSQDNSGYFPYNADESQFQTNSIDWVTGILSWGNNNPDNTNQNDLSQALLGPYIINQIKIYKCPSDIFLCNENNQILPRTRSISMNNFIGDNFVYGYCNYLKESDIINISSSMLYIFIDEQPFSINDGFFLFYPSDSSFIDTPANYHNQHGCLSFFDGHVELHKWVNNYLWPQLSQPNTSTPRPLITEGTNGADIMWLRQRASVLIIN